MNVVRHFSLLVVILLCLSGCAGELQTYNYAKDGSAAYNAGDFSAALEQWQAGLDQARRSENKKDEAMFLFNIGLVHERLSQFPEALDSYQQALEIQQEIGETRGEANTLNNIGIIYNKQGQYAEAQDYYQQALQLRQKVKDKEGSAKILNNLGTVYQHLGQYSQAEEHYQQALAIRQAGSNKAGEANTLNNLGTLFWIRGRYQQALDSYQHALAIRREIEDTTGTGSTLNNIGVIYWNLGLYENALEFYQEALDMRQATQDKGGEASNLNNIGVVYWKIGDDELALEHYQQALIIRQQIGDRRGQSNTLNNIGKIYERLGEHVKALEYYQQALDISQDIGDKRGEANTLNNLGGTYQQLKKQQDALSTFRQSLQLNQELGMPDGLWIAHSGMASLHVELQAYDRAIEHYELALDALEALRAGLTEKEHKISFMQEKFYLYDELIELLYDLHQRYPGQGYDRKALEIFERKQGRLFLEEMGKSGARLFAGLSPELKEQEEKLETRLAQLNQQIVKEYSSEALNHKRLRKFEEQKSRLQEALNALKSRLKKETPDYYALKYPQPVGLDELQTQVLHSEEMMLVYGVMQDQTILWLIQPEGLMLYNLPLGEEKLRGEIAELRNLLWEEWGSHRGLIVPGQAAPEASEPQKSAAEQSHLLYKQLIPEELRGIFQGKSSLHIVPTGPLYALPFEALATSLADTSPHFLIEKLPISYLSSASLLKTLRDAQTRNNDPANCPLLAFAHPQYTSDVIELEKEVRSGVRSIRSQAYRELLDVGLSELPETEDEAREIAELLEAPEETAPLQLRDRASRDTILRFNQEKRLANYQYLLFAMHGVMPGEVSHLTQSALILSDDFLTMGDVFGLELNAKLVALSACNTGRGEQIRGEGVMGLTRAFMYAGAPSIAVTLWSVESLSAKTMSVGLFRNLKDGQTPAQALRAIKLGMLRGEEEENYRHPFYWAPFVVFGDGL